MNKQHVMITGGSSGIGLELAKLFAQDDYDVSIFGRDEKKLMEAQAQIKKWMRSDRKCLFYQTDVSDEHSVKEKIYQSIQDLGIPKILITSAGIAKADYFEHLTTEDFKQQMDVNYFGTLYPIQVVLPFMKGAKKGHLVLISSAAALTGIFGYTAYGASKFAVRGLAESLRSELKPFNIQVSVVYPTDTDTPQLEEENKNKPSETKRISESGGKVLSPVEVAETIKKGISQHKFIITPNLTTNLLAYAHSLLNPFLQIYQDKLVKAMKPREKITNWGLTFSFTPEKILYPKHIDEIIALILQARKQQKKIRAVGSLYSYTPLVKTDTLLLSLDNYTGINSIDKKNMEVSVKAGTKLDDLEKLLFQEGLGLKSLGDINKQSLGGFISTGCHGTGKNNQGFSSSITWMRLVKADGSLLEVSPQQHPELFKASQVSLGCLGIITDVKIKVLPAFNVTIDKSKISFEECLKHLDDNIKNNDCYEFFWFPYTHDVLEKKINFTQEKAKEFQPLKYFNDYFLENFSLWTICELSRIFPTFYRKHAHQIIPYFLTKSHSLVNCQGCYATPRLVKHFEVEYAIPYEHGKETLSALKKILEEDPTHNSFPIEVRYTQKDDIYLSPAYEQNCLWVAVHAYVKDDYEELFKKCEKLFLEMGGRPHWGKLHWRKDPDFQKLYPHWNKFKEIRHQLDPGKLFYNSYLATIFGELHEDSDRPS